MLALTPNPIDVKAVRDSVSDPGFGAVIVFEGTARNHFDGRPVLQLAYEVYEELAIPVLEQIAQEMHDKWPCKVAIVHRTGAVPREDPTGVSAVGAAHRAACYDASRYALEQRKARLRVWKKEVYSDGSAWKANDQRQPR